MMKLLGLKKPDEIVFEITVEQRVALVTFLDRSLQTTQVDFDEHSPFDRAQVRNMRAAIAGTLANPARWLVLPRLDWHQLVKLASGWRWLGYEGRSPGVELDVPYAQVETVLHLADEVGAAERTCGE